MKTNITTDNYEAYLLDYIEGNLSPDETKQLKDFIAAQGLDWNELTAPLPYLEAPQVAYNDKEKLKKKAAVVPLYVKIASAAAVAGLLLTVSLRPEKSMPEAEPIVELKPILPERLITASEATTTLPPRTMQLVQPHVVKKEKPTVSENIAEAISERAETPLVAQLEPQKAHILPTSTTFNELWLTNGRHDSFASLIGAGVSKAKQDLTEAATDMALAAYSNFNEQFEETKERWEEKQEK